MTYRCITVLVLSLGICGVSVSAHHAAAVAYHVDKEITVQGVVTEVIPVAGQQDAPVVVRGLEDH